MAELGHYVWLLIGLLVTTSLTTGLLRSVGAGLRLFPLWALLRAIVQLATVALLLRGILAVPSTVVAFVALMLSTASWTAGHRLGQLWRGPSAAVLGVLVGAGSGLVVVFGLRLLDFDVRNLVAVGGILIGNAMSAATLAGRNFDRASRARSMEIEAWLSLGATPAQAHREIGQEAIRESLIPGLDQTKSTGLVVLPGAFVGALFGGSSPAHAAEFQLVVLAGIALVMSVAAIVVTQRVGRTPYVVAA